MQFAQHRGFLFRLVVLFGIVKLCPTELTAQINDDLLVHYSLDGNFEDSSPNGLDGIGFNYSFGEDHLGNASSALVANGINTFVQFPADPSLKPQFPFSMDVITKFGELNGEQIVVATDFSDYTHSGAWIQVSSSLALTASFGSAGGSFTSATRNGFLADYPLETDTWYHILVIWRGHDDIDIYLNCELLEGSYSGSAQNIGYTSAAGTLCRKYAVSSGAPYFFDGGVDEFRFWNREVSVEEVFGTCLTSAVMMKFLSILRGHVWMRPWIIPSHLMEILFGTKEPSVGALKMERLPMITVRK